LLKNYFNRDDIKKTKKEIVIILRTLKEFENLGRYWAVIE